MTSVKLIGMLFAATSVAAFGGAHETARIKGTADNDQPASFSRLQVDTSALPQDKAFLGEIVLTRAKERTAFSEKGWSLDVSFALDAALTGETCRVSVCGNRASVRAGRVRGLIFGAGALLRSVDWRTDSFAVPEGERTVAPAKPIRCAYYARHFYNWYHMASYEELLRLTEDLALWGVNELNYQFAYPVVDRRYAKGNDIARFETVSRQFAKALERMDLDLFGSGGGNQAPHDTDPSLKAEPNTDPKRGNFGFNVCPAKPGGLDFLIRQEQRFLDDYCKDLRIAHFSHWPFDEGGCECAVCRPWGGNGYLKLCKALSALYRARYPEATTCLSTWTFHDDEYQMLYDYLATDESKWIGMLQIDSHGDFPGYPLTHKLPRDIPIITFPEISMWGREPWGGFGAIAMPARFERLFREVEAIASGFMFYSEGLSEDINKVVVTQLYADPSRHWQDIVREYGRWEFPGTDPDRFVELVAHLENTHALPDFKKKTQGAQEVGRGSGPVFADFESRCRYCLDEATKAEALSADLERTMSPARRIDWRWRHIRLRTIIDKEIFTARKWNTPVADAAYRELVKIYNAERTYSWVRPPVK